MNNSGDNDGRWYPDHPFVGVGALVVKDGRCLLIQRGKEPSKGKWSIPGGKVELGETIESAVRREVLEECGIDIIVLKILEATDSIIRD
ncbi:MAG: NUDIX domain-containing protein, partial [Dehalococcoidales bacterium]|nr:NUDIX domain-containing protein [Dehalococcoidales bacterium]